jgi:hypothetical protein
MLVGSNAKFLWFPSQFQCWHKAVSSETFLTAAATVTALQIQVSSMFLVQKTRFKLPKRVNPMKSP